MIRPAKRLFDWNGREIFRSEDIQRDGDYFVSGAEDFIDPLYAIEGIPLLVEHFIFLIKYSFSMVLFD